MTEIAHSGPKWPQPNYEQGGLEPGEGNPLPDPRGAAEGFAPHDGATTDHNARSHVEHIDQLNRLLQGQ